MVFFGAKLQCYGVNAVWFPQVDTALRRTETEDYSLPVRSKAKLDTASTPSSSISASQATS